MNKKLSVKTDDRYLRLMEWWPKEGQERCSRCCLDKDSEDCQALCGLCKPLIGDNTLTGLETGGFFVESKPIPRPNSGGDRGFRERRHGGKFKKGGFHKSRYEKGWGGTGSPRDDEPPRRDKGWGGTGSPRDDEPPRRETKW